MSKGTEAGQREFSGVSVVSEEKTSGDFRWEATIRPDGDPEKTEVRWYRWDREVERWRFYGNDGPSGDELSEGAREKLGRVYGFILEKRHGRERRESIERNVDPEE
jgi:hypothetical protein